MRIVLALILTAAACGTFATPSRAAGGADEAAAIQEMMQLTQPGAAHKLLNPFVGTWDATVKFWLAGPGTPPTEDKGTSTYKWVLDGRFMMQEMSASMTMPDGNGGSMKMPFKGMGYLGYDNYRNLYVSTWIDNMGTAIMNMSGSAQPGGKIMHMYGSMDEPMLKVIGREIHTVTRWVNDDQVVFEMFDLHAGPDYKVMEITYTRKKA